MPASRPMDELRKQAADLIVDRLKTESVAAVALKLQISRQAVYDIKKGKYCPSLTLVGRACAAWKVTFTYEGVRIDSGSFPEKVELLAPATQMTLVDLLRQLDSRDFEVVQAKPNGRALEITLRLTIPERRAAG